MGTRRRLTKRQLRQDKFVSSTFELAQFVQQHARRVAMGLIVLGVAIGGAFYYLNYREHREKRAAELLAAGVLAYEAGNYPLAISDLEKVQSEYPGTTVGGEAALLLSDTHYRAGNNEEARRVLLEFTARHGKKSPLSYQAYLLLGKAQENLEDFDEAAKAYLSAEESARFDYQRIEAVIGAARAFSRAEKDQEAIEEYQSLLDHYPDSPEAQRAELLLAESEARTQAGAK